MARPINWKRNAEIAELRKKGLSYRQIARILKVDVRTAFIGFRKEKERLAVDLSTV